jgi:hypothetical protein
MLCQEIYNSRIIKFKQILQNDIEIGDCEQHIAQEFIDTLTFLMYYIQYKYNHSKQSKNVKYKCPKTLDDLIITDISLRYTEDDMSDRSFEYSGDIQDITHNTSFINDEGEYYIFRQEYIKTEPLNATAYKVSPLVRKQLIKILQFLHEHTVQNIYDIWL